MSRAETPPPETVSPADDAAPTVGPADDAAPATEPAADDTLLAALEAILMIADSAVPSEAMAAALGLTPAEVRSACSALQADYDGANGRRRGFELRSSAAGWRIYSRPEHHDIVTDFLTAGQSATLSQAALETLAVIAYRQPVTRARVSAIRGVNVDGVVRTLLMRGLIVEAGTEAVSGARQFVTTEQFLDSLGIDSLDELPEIAPFLPAEDELAEDGLADDDLTDPADTSGADPATTSGTDPADAAGTQPAEGDDTPG